MSYFLENTNLPITADIIEEVIKNTHIFNNIVLVSCPYIIKMFPKFNMAIIQIDI